MSFTSIGTVEVSKWVRKEGLDGWEMGQEVDGKRPVWNESCFTFSKAFSFSPDHRDSLKEMLETYWGNKNYEAGTSDFLIKKHIITSLHGATLEDLWSCAGEDWPVKPNRNSKHTIIELEWTGV